MIHSRPLAFGKARYSAEVRGELEAMSAATIDRYLLAEQPYDCAGSFKSEGLGISLFRSTEGEDTSSLIGLPLIRLVDMLLNEGIEVP